MQPEVNNNYHINLLNRFWETFLAYQQVIFTENLDSWAIFGNSYCGNCSETENLANTTFSPQFFALSPQKPIIGTQWMTKKYLIFLFNVLFTLKHSFRVFLTHKLHWKSQIFWHCYVCYIVLILIIAFRYLLFYFEGFDWHFWQSTNHWSIHR